MPVACREHRGTSSEEIISSVIDDIVEQDRQELDGNDPQANIIKCTCPVEYSARFSLKVMEALRSMQRERNEFPTVEDIVRYVEKNYCINGDVRAQVRTTLKTVCRHGFVMKLMENEYHFIGPMANAMNESDPDRVSKRMRRRVKRLSSTRHDSAGGRKSSNCSCQRTSRRGSRSRQSQHGRRLRNDRRERSRRIGRVESSSSSPASSRGGTRSVEETNDRAIEPQDQPTPRRDEARAIGNHVLDLLRTSYERARTSLPFFANTERAEVDRSSARQSQDLPTVATNEIIRGPAVGASMERSPRNRSAHPNTGADVEHGVSYVEDESPVEQRQPTPVSANCLCRNGSPGPCTCDNNNEVIENRVTGSRPSKCKTFACCTRIDRVERRRNQLRNRRRIAKSRKDADESDVDSAYHLLRGKVSNRQKFAKHHADVKKWILRCRQESRRRRSSQ